MLPEDSKNTILKGKDVEIITDLDIIEIASLDYKLHRFNPLTYRGQKVLCERLCLNLYNSIDCSRNILPENSNLRDYIPSKMLHVPGDGNC